MTVHAITREAKKLTPNERWELIQELMEIETEERTSVTLTPAQAADLDRRIAEEHAGKGKNIPGDEAVAMIRQHFKKNKKRA